MMKLHGSQFTPGHSPMEQVQQSRFGINSCVNAAEQNSELVAVEMVIPEENRTVA